MAYNYDMHTVAIWLYSYSYNVERCMCQKDGQQTEIAHYNFVHNYIYVYIYVASYIHVAIYTSSVE